jgi:hypothetical protein
MLVCSTSGKLGDVSLFGGSTSDLLGGSMVTEDTKSKPKVEDVALESEVRGTGCWPAAAQCGMAAADYTCAQGVWAAPSLQQ